MMGADGLDWPAMIRAGLHGLQMHPRDFWALTPAELMVMLGVERGQAPLSRARLGELLDMYPDQSGGLRDE